MISAPQLEKDGLIFWSFEILEDRFHCFAVKMAWVLRKITCYRCNKGDVGTCLNHRKHQRAVHSLVSFLFGFGRLLLSIVCEKL